MWLEEIRGMGIYTEAGTMQFVLRRSRRTPKLWKRTVTSPEIHELRERWPSSSRTSQTRSLFRVQRR